MINTSIAYKRAIRENREFRVKDKITFADGSTLQLSIEDFMSYTIDDAVSSSGKFEVGTAIMKEYKVVLCNEDGKFDSYSFEDADIQCIVGLKLEDGTWEDLNKGTYRITAATRSETTITLTAYDHLLFLDYDYSNSTLAYPATIQQIISNACQNCQLDFNASTVEMGGFVVKERPSDNALTYRDIIGYCAQVMGSFARIDHLGRLSFGWYAIDSINEDIDGGTLADYTSGDEVDGGALTDYSSGDEYDSGTFVDADYYHHFYNFSSQTINAENIKITAVKVTAKTKNSGDTAETKTLGESGYTLEITDNPLIGNDADSVATVANHVYTKFKDMVFRPVSISIQSDPSIEAGDVARITDRQHNTYNIAITATTFALCGSQKVECSAETPTEKNYSRYGAAAKLTADIEARAENRLNAYDIAVQNMNQLAANTFGFYATTVKQDDGSILAYRHDKPKLAESKIVYKSGIDGFFVTTDYQGTDEATTAADKWESGFDSSGNATVNILSAIGINFSWAYGGTLTLGGDGNGNGKLTIRDANNNEIGYIDNTGVNFLQGYFSGKLSAISGDIGGWKLGDGCIYSGSEPGLYGTTLYSDGRIVADFSSSDGEVIDVGPKFIVESTGIDMQEMSIQNVEMEEATINTGTIAGWKFTESGIYSGTSLGSDDGTTLYADGRIKIGDITMAQDGALTVKYGLHVYNKTSGSQFTDGTGLFKIFNTTTSTSGTALVMSSQAIYRQASSSKRFKDIEKDLSVEELEEWYKIQPVWAKYKDGYLSEGDPKDGMYMPMFIAEDVAEHFPEAATTGDDGQIEDWNHRVMIPAMWQMLKEQKAEIDALKAQVEELKNGNKE